MARRDFLRHLGFELANATQTNKPNMEKTLTESEKIEQLMKPRYKVIGEYPRSNYYFKLNEIVKLPELDNRAHLALQEWFAIIQPSHKKELTSSEPLLPLIMHESSFNLYPHLFRKLEWWEERAPEEMPEYMKHKDGKRFVIVLEYKGDCFIAADDLTFPEGLSNWLPSTEQEYSNSFLTHSQAGER